MIELPTALPQISFCFKYVKIENSMFRSFFKTKFHQPSWKFDENLSRLLTMVLVFFTDI